MNLSLADVRRLGEEITTANVGAYTRPVGSAPLAAPTLGVAAERKRVRRRARG